MNRPLVDKLTRTLLYEGYILYPYRPSVKNSQRWTFGGLYPESWSQAQAGSDAAAMQTECLIHGGGALQVIIRFLHLVDRTVVAGAEPNWEVVGRLEVAGTEYQPWQEAVEREVDLGEFDVKALAGRTRELTFEFAEHRAIESLRGPGDKVAGALIRRREAVRGTVELSCVALRDDLYRVRVRILNRTDLANPESCGRDEALMRSLVSTHTVLGIRGAKFVSLTDPPEPCRDAAAHCKNVGAWPVLVGDPALADTILSSPIILYDYPEIAPESPGDLFDATEIDEILSLRILTLTDQEKRSAAAVDPRAKDLLARTEALAREQLMGLHGTVRGLKPVAEPWSPFEMETQFQRIDRVAAGDGAELKTGDRVKLRPLGRADVMDLALDGKTATIVSIEEDYEKRIHLAVTVDDDPGKDLGLTGQPGHRFFFGIEEVEPLGLAEQQP